MIFSRQWFAARFFAFNTFFVTAVVFASSFSFTTAKEPITDGEQDETMKAVDPYLIDAFYGSDSKGLTGRFG